MSWFVEIYSYHISKIEIYTSHDYLGEFGVNLNTDYKFISPDIGENCYASNVQVFIDSEVRDAINDGMIDFAESGPLLGDDQETPYFIIGDNAFPLDMDDEALWMLQSARA